MKERRYKHINVNAHCGGVQTLRDVHSMCIFRAFLLCRISRVLLGTFGLLFPKSNCKVAIDFEEVNCGGCKTASF
jgi:hypothetical protein